MSVVTPTFIIEPKKAPESKRNGGDAHERHECNVVAIHRFGHVVERYDKEVTATLVFPD